MQLENVIKRLLKFINTRTEALSITVTSGGVDNMEKYQYIIGQNKRPRGNKTGTL